MLTVDPGDSVRFSTPNAGWDVGRDQPFEPRNPELDTGHALAGPIEVRGARAGQVLAVRIDEVVPRLVGRHVRRRGSPDRLGARAATWAEQRAARSAWLRSSACSGCRRPSRASTRRSRRGRCGGNIDCKELVAGTTLYLPIPVDGALFSAGDGHAAQGDGEVSGTAIEAPVEAQVTLDVRDDLELEWPIARIDGAWLTFGFDEHLGRAARIAVDGMLDLMEREHGLAPDRTRSPSRRSSSTSASPRS